MDFAFELAVTEDVFDISEIAQFFDHDKSGSISQLTKGKSRDLQKLLKYFNPIQDGEGAKSLPPTSFPL